MICFLGFWWHLGSVGLIDETEPLFAEAARQMVETGDWITPYFNGETRFDKPPLVYWLMAIAYQTIGVNEWGVRFPSALGATALTVGGFLILRRFGAPIPALGGAADSTSIQTSETQRWLAAWIGSGFLAFNLQTLVWARTGVSDMLLSGCIGTALFCFFAAYAEPERQIKRLGYLGFYIFCGLAVLAKGPVGIVLPGLIVLAFLLYLGKFREVWREAMPIWGIVLFLAIAVPWYILVFQANGQDYIDSFFGYHNFERFTSVVNQHSAPWYFYFLIVLLGFAPYSAYLPLAMGRLRFWRWQDWRSQPRSTHLGLFALMWFAVIFIFFTVAVTKLPSYVIPLIPGAALLVALQWSAWMTAPSRASWGRWLTHGTEILLMVGLAGIMLYSPNFLGTDLATPEFPAAMQASGVPMIGAAIWGGGAIATLVLLWRRQGRWLWGVQLATFALFLIFALTPALFVMDAQRQLPIRQMADEILAQQRRNEPIVMIGFAKPSLVFYTQQPIKFLSNSREAVNYFLSLPMEGRRQRTLLSLSLRYRIVESDLRPRDYRVLKTIGKYNLVRIRLPLSIAQRQNPGAGGGAQPSSPAPTLATE
ncbi:MAG: glycosyltransferase family 39 protein [Cyanobacteria bacterium J06638_20]